MWTKSIKSEVRGSSWRRYSDYVRVHLIPGLGKVALAKLTPQHVKLFCTHKLEEGLSATTVRNIHGMLHRALDDALRMGLVQRNVAEMIRAPRRSTSEMATLSEMQACQLLAGVKGDRFEALYTLALTTGMRQGELLALRWQDIDLAHGSLHVCMNVQESDGRFVLAEVKTTYSRRNIALTSIAIEAL